MVQLTSTHTTGKTIVLTIWTFIGKVMSLLFNTLSRESQGWGILVGCRLWGRRVRHDWATSLSLFTFMHWRRKWQPTPVFLPGESQGRGSLVGCPLCAQSWTRLKRLSSSSSRFVMAFLPGSKHLLISWLQSPSAVILEPKKIKSHCFHCFPIYLP